jgi:hypothetical protein
VAVERLRWIRRGGERCGPEEVHDTPQQTGDAKLTELPDRLPGENLSAGVVSEEPMQVIDAFEEGPERQSRHCAQYKAVAERQSGSLEDHSVIVHASYSEGQTDNTAKAYECNQRHQACADDAEDDADFHDGKAYAAVECRSMILGAIAFFIYALSVTLVLRRFKPAALMATLALMPIWFAVSMGLWLL